MRTPSLLVVACLLGCDARPAADEDDIPHNSVEQVIAQCAEALGGTERLEALTTFRTRTSWDGEEPVVVEIQRPNLMRTAGRSTMVFDGERAARLRGPAGNEDEDVPKLLDAAVWKDFEIDLAFRFPAFFDYPTEYVGIDSADGIEAHQLLVTLPLGTRVTYLVDTNTHLPILARTAITIDGTDYTPERTYREFLEVEGILFPRSFTQGWTPETAQNGIVEMVEVNLTFADDNFRIPMENRP